MDFDRRWKNILGGFAICAVLTVSGWLYLDIRLARFVSGEVGPAFLFSKSISNLPDLLFLLVSIVTLLSWTGRLYLSQKPVKWRNLDLLEYIGSAVPLAFILKQVLKDLFGRTNTRFWLLHPGQLGFHWFHGGGNFSGFPSGHMAVFTVLMLGISRYFPRFRLPCAALLLMLALALIITQYHFFSDIVAGFYLGVIVDLFTREGLSLLHRSWAGRTARSRSADLR